MGLFDDLKNKLNPNKANSKAKGNSSDGDSDWEIIEKPNDNIKEIEEPELLVKKKLFIPIAPSFDTERENFPDYFTNKTLYVISNEIFPIKNDKEFPGINKKMQSVVWEQKFVNEKGEEEIYHCCAMKRKFENSRETDVIFFSKVLEMHAEDLKNSRNGKLDYMEECRIYDKFMFSDHPNNVYVNKKDDDYIRDYELDGNGGINNQESLYYKLYAEYTNKEIDDALKAQTSNAMYKS